MAWQCECVQEFLPISPALPLLIATQHPGLGGGVLTLVRAFLNWVRSTPGLAPELAYPPLQPADPVNATVERVLLGRWRPGSRRETWDGIDAHCVGKLLPRVEALTGTGNSTLWRQCIEDIDLFQVICGYAVTGVPLALTGKRFVAWVATSMDGDKQARLRSAPCHRRLAHRLQARRLLHLERLVLERAAWVFALSPYTRDELLERGAAADRMSCLPCPVEIDRFRPATEPPAQLTVLSAARPNDPRKNTTLLLRAFARIAPSLPGVRLQLVGEGDFGPLKKLADQLQLGGQTDFFGFRATDELPELYRQASVFAIPSDQEGQCIAGLEAMASGLPVVSTRCGGPEMYVLPEQTGLLVEREHEQQLADALHYLLTDHAARERMGRQARQLVEKQYAPEVFARHLREVYARVWPNVLGAAFAAN